MIRFNFSKSLFLLPFLSYAPASYSEVKANLAQSEYCYARSSFVVDQADILFEDVDLEEGMLKTVTKVAVRSKERLLSLKTDTGVSQGEVSEYIDNLASRLDDKAQQNKASYSGLGESVSRDVLTNCQIFVTE